MIFYKSNVMEKGQAFQQMMLVQLDIHRQNVKFNLNLMSHIKITSKFAIPGGLVVRTWHFHCHGLDSVPDQGTKVLQDLQCGPKFSFKFNLKNYLKIGNKLKYKGQNYKNFRKKWKY